MRSRKLDQVRSRKLGQLERSRKLGQLRRRGPRRTRKAAVDAGTLLGLQVRTFALRADLAIETEGPQMSANNHRIGPPAVEGRHESIYSPLRILVGHCVGQNRVVVAVREVLGRRVVQSGVVVAVHEALRLRAACKESVEVRSRL